MSEPRNMRGPVPSGDPKRARELAELYAGGMMTMDERIEMDAWIRSGNADIVRELARVARVVEGMLEVQEVAPPESVRARIERELSDSSSAGERVHEGGRAERDGRRAARAEAAMSAGVSQGLTILRAADQRWLPTGVRGVRFRQLSADWRANRRTVLLDMDPGSELPEHGHAGLEEVYVVSGDLSIGNEELKPGDYFRVQPGCEHGTPRTRDGCVCIVISGYSPFPVKSWPSMIWSAVKGWFGRKGTRS